MAKKIDHDLKNLLEIINCHPEGITIQALLDSLPASISKRTLQARLSKLAQSGHVELEGVGRASKYKSTTLIESLLPSSIIPLSQESLKIREAISLPIQKRKPVTYRREFLTSYKPNHTYYLPIETREKLAKIGKGLEQSRPAGTYARKIYQRLLVDLSWNSSRLEGNTYSLLETERLLEIGEEIPGKNHVETQMILNHKEAIEFLVDMAEEININRFTILNIHGLLSNNLLADPRASGRLRKNAVKIGMSVYHPIEVPQSIEEYFNLIIEKASAIENPFEQSFFLMVHLPYLQPFEDVNKRVSRLAGNIPFIRENLSPLSFVDVPQEEYVQGLLAIYELNRIELFRDLFVWAYERSADLYSTTIEALGEPDLFKMKYREQIREVVSWVVKEKMDRLRASKYVAIFAHKNVPGEDNVSFIRTVENEVSALHEGNFARYKLRPSEFFAWKELWR